MNERDLIKARAWKDEKVRKVASAERVLQMEHLRGRRSSQHSAGQRKRVAIGCAILRKAKLFLFDESLLNFDAALLTGMRIDTGKLHQSPSASMIFTEVDVKEDGGDTALVG